MLYGHQIIAGIPSFFPFAMVAIAQQNTINCQVVDLAGGEPVPFATVAYYESGSTVPVDGTTTDLDCRFSLDIVLGD